MRVFHSACSAFLAKLLSDRELSQMDAEAYEYLESALQDAERVASELKRLRAPVAPSQVVDASMDF